MKNKMFIGIVIVLSVAILMGCSGPDQKKAKFYNKGKMLYEKGDYVRAKLEFKNAIQIDIKYADAYYMLGMAALKSGDPRGAYGSFSKAVELSPQHPGANAELGWFLLGAGKPDEAMGKAELVLKSDAKSEDALILKGAVLVKKKDNEGALRFLESVVGKEVRKPDGYLFLTAAYPQSGDVPRAEKTLLDGIKANEKSVPLYLALVRFYLSQKKTDEAVALMQKVIAMDPEVVQYRIGL